MLAFPSMLLSAADAAGISHPPANRVNYDDYDPEEFPHWHALCLTQLERRMQPGEHFENAKALAKIPVERLKKMTMHQLQAAGVGCGQ